MTLRVAVVGGAGYIGSHMVKYLRTAGHEVAVFDNLARGHRDSIPADVPLVQGDLLNPADLEGFLAGRRIDVAMHFAALCYVGESVVKPREYYRNNVTGTLNLLDAMLAAGVTRLVFSSSCATYGAPREIPMTESHPQVPVNPYGWSKLFAEQALRDYAAAYGLRSVSLRYFNAAGSDPEGRLGERHDPETHIIPLALMEARRVMEGGDPRATGLVVHGGDYATRDGTCVRDYIHVDDLAAAHLAAAERLVQDRVGSTEAYNLGNGEGFSVKEVIESCRRVTGADIRFNVGPRREGDPAELVGSATRAREVLGWRPRHARLDDIVATAWKWFGRGLRGS